MDENAALGPSRRRLSGGQRTTFVLRGQVSSSSPNVSFPRTAVAVRRTCCRSGPGVARLRSQPPANLLSPLRGERRESAAAVLRVKSAVVRLGPGPLVRFGARSPVVPFQARCGARSPAFRLGDSSSRSPLTPSHPPLRSRRFGMTAQHALLTTSGRGHTVLVH